MLVTGGGGYQPAMVTRCWAYETAILAGLGSVYSDFAEEFDSDFFSGPISPELMNAMLNVHYVRDRELEIGNKVLTKNDAKKAAALIAGLPKLQPYAHCMDERFVCSKFFLSGVLIS